MLRPSREGPNYFVSSKFTSGYRKLSQINDFLIPSTGAQARRTCRRGAPERERERESARTKRTRKSEREESASEAKREQRGEREEARNTRSIKKTGGDAREGGRWSAGARGRNHGEAARPRTHAGPLFLNHGILRCVKFVYVKKERRPSCRGPKGIISLHILEGESESMKNQWFSSPRDRRARAAYPQERIPFNGF